MPSTVALPDAVRVADEEGADTLLLAERDHAPRSLVAQVPDLAALASGHLSSGRLQFAPAAGAVGAAFALLGKLPQRLVVPPLERADTPPRDHQRRARIRGHRGLMNLAQVYCCLRLAWGGFRMRGG